MIYMLNLRYDGTNGYGVFEDNDEQNTTPLLTSKRWLSAGEPPRPWSFDRFNPAEHMWTEVGARDKKDKLITLRKSENPLVLVRLWAPNAPSSHMIRLTVAFGRKNRGSRVSSPFILETSRMFACCVFDEIGGPRGDGSYCWSLGYIQTGPAPNSNQPNTYEFVVGATVKFSNNTVLSFGHDPEMDVAS